MDTHRPALHCKGSPETGTQPEELDGFYHDLKDDDNKQIAVKFASHKDKAATMVITPPPVTSPYFVPGIGRNWTVTARVKDNCVAPKINFDVPNKPNPPPTPIEGVFVYGPLGDLD